MLVCWHYKKKEKKKRETLWRFTYDTSPDSNTMLCWHMIYSICIILAYCYCLGLQYLYIMVF